MDVVNGGRCGVQFMRAFLRVCPLIYDDGMKLLSLLASYCGALHLLGPS